MTTEEIDGSTQSPIGIRKTRHRPPPKGAGDGVFCGFHQLDFEHSQIDQRLAAGRIIFSPM